MAGCKVSRATKATLHSVFKKSDTTKFEQSGNCNGNWLAGNDYSPTYYLPVRWKGRWVHCKFAAQLSFQTFNFCKSQSHKSVAKYITHILNITMKPKDAGQETLTIFSRLQTSTGKFAKCISNLQEQYVWVVVLLHLYRIAPIYDFSSF
jgi:hypothetical protein